MPVRLRASGRQCRPWSSERCTSTVIPPARRARGSVCSLPRVQLSPPFGDVTWIALESTLGQPASCLVTDCEPRLQARKSGEPSPLKSETAIQPGVLPPVPNDCAGSNWPFPTPRSTVVTLLVLLFATAMSGMPLWSQSPMFTAFGPEPGVIGMARRNVPSGTPPVPFPSRTLTVLAPLFATARSAMPSALKSATAIWFGDAPVLYEAGGENVPSPLPLTPLPNRIRTPLPDTARSVMPSPLKSYASSP